MSPDPPGTPTPRSPTVGSGAPASRRLVDALTLALYLAAFVVPGVGSTLVWIVGRAWTQEGSLAVHYRRALAIQQACVAGMVLIQSVVAMALWAGFPGEGPPELRPALVLAGLHTAGGLYLAMGLVGPVLLLAERQGPPAPPPRRVERRAIALARPAPRVVLSPAASTRKVPSG